MSTVQTIWQADDEGVKLITLKEECRISFDEFVQKLQSGKTTTPILPYGTIWFESNATDKLFVIQVPPRKRMIAYYEMFYEIGFPWLIVKVKQSGAMIANVGLALSREPIETFDAPVLRLPLPNMDDRALLCLGYEFNVLNAGQKTDIKRVNDLIEYIETSKYNNHLLPADDWIPSEIRGDYELPTQYGSASDMETAMLAYHGVLEAWAALSADDNWKDKITDLTWTGLSSFSDFVRRNA